MNHLCLRIKCAVFISKKLLTQKCVACSLTNIVKRVEQVLLFHFDVKQLFSYSGLDCNDPSGLTGVCKPIPECRPVLLELKARKDDAEYLEFLRQSHANCKYVKPNICCPVPVDDGALRFFAETSKGSE
jgi:Regulatory CLIP domain of proteinases